MRIAQYTAVAGAGAVADAGVGAAVSAPSLAPVQDIAQGYYARLLREDITQERYCAKYSAEILLRKDIFSKILPILRNDIL